MWLIEAQSFAYHDGRASFTGRKQQRKGFWYWYAYVRRDGRLRCIYLGRSNSLTVERLQTIARALHPVTGDTRDVAHIHRHNEQMQQKPSVQRGLGHVFDNSWSQNSPRLNISRVRTELAEIEVQLAQHGKRKMEAGLQALDLAELVLQALSEEREQVRVIVATLRKVVQ